MPKYSDAGDIDLDQEVVLDSQGERITEARAQEIAEDAVAEVRARRGRPSLTGGRQHSPQIAFRVPQHIAQRAAEIAEREGKSLSELGREALERYLNDAA